MCTVRCATVPLLAVCFTHAPAACDPALFGELNRNSLVELEERGIADSSGTTLVTPRGPVLALRVANTNHRSRRGDFDLLLEAVVRIGQELRM